MERLETRLCLVFPARAGMIPSGLDPRAEGARIPRESGDDPVLDIMRGGLGGYSPRERG